MDTDGKWSKKVILHLDLNPGHLRYLSKKVEKFCLKLYHCTVVKHRTRKGEINYFEPYEGLNWV